MDHPHPEIPVSDGALLDDVRLVMLLGRHFVRYKVVDGQPHPLFYQVTEIIGDSVVRLARVEDCRNGDGLFYPLRDRFLEEEPWTWVVRDYRHPAFGYARNHARWVIDPREIFVETPNGALYLFPLVLPEP